MTSHQRYNTFSKLFSTIWRNNKQIQFRLTIGVILVILGSLLSLTIPWCLKFIVEYFNKPNLSSTLVLLITSYGLLWLMSHLIVDVRQIIVYRVFEKGIHKFTSQIFQKILSLSMKYHTSNTTGNIMNSIERGQNAIPVILFGILFIIFPMIIEIVIATSVLWYYYGLIIAGILLLIFLVYMVFSWYCVSWVVSAQREGNKQHQRVSDYITDVLMNIEGIHYQSAQKPVSAECEGRMMSREDAVTRELIRMDVVSIGQTIIAGVGFICMTLMVGFKVVENKLGVGDFILVNGYLIQFLVPLSAIGSSMFRAIRENFTRMEDVMKLLNEEDDIVESSKAKIIKQEPSDIIFNNVFFIYPNKEEYTLKDISFNIQKGKSIAIVGSNGAGKSTIAKLLYRLFDISHGEILIQNNNIKDIKLSQLRQLIGIVPQEIFLLNDTIYSNLVFGLEGNISEAFFKEVTQITNMDKWVNTLPDRYNTIVGEQGVKLSGGEKKRIAIARTLFRNPKILILDEAMSFLDIDTEHQILNHIQDKFKGLTRIVITHHDKYLEDVDEVIYIKKGFIQSRGKHKDLLKHDKEYKMLWLKEEKKQDL